MRSMLSALVLMVAISVPVAVFADKTPPAAEAPAKDKPEAAKVEKCEAHGVKKSLCARCNPKLEKVFKAKKDWCGEHSRPESQCVLCHPELAKEGVK